MEEGQNFCLQWNSYQASVTGLFDSLRRDGELVDVTLCAQGQTIKVHRMMLSACSPYFRDVLKGDLGTHPVFFMRDISFKDLSNIVEFMYRGKVNVAQSELGSFLKTAESLQVRGLTGDEEPAQQESQRKPKPASVAHPPPPPPPPPQHPRLSPEPQRQRSQPESPRQRLPQPPTLPLPPPPPQQPQHTPKRSHSPPPGGAPKLDGEARAGAPKRARSLEELEQEPMSVKQEPVAVDDGELSYLGGDNSAGSGGLSLSAEEGGAPMGFLSAGHPQPTEFHDEDLLAAVAGPSGFTQDQDGGATPGGGLLNCRYCGQAFSQSSHRARHERCVHERHKDFTCPICGRLFSRQDNMKDHMKRRHGFRPPHQLPRLPPPVPPGLMAAAAAAAGASGASAADSPAVPTVASEGASSGAASSS